jgi:hypothetical protein
MRYIVLLLFPFLHACSILGPGEFDFSVDIVDIQNTPEGVRLILAVDSDGEDITLAGAGFGRDSVFSITRNQEEARVNEEGQLEVLFPQVDDGLVYFQAFAAFDAFYALSEVIALDVRSARVSAPCSPGVNGLRINLSSCGPGQAIVRTEEGRNGEFEIQLSCNRGEYSEVNLIFPRNPTSGTYLISNSIFAVPAATKVVQTDILWAGRVSNFTAGQELYVNRVGDQTEITLCDLVFPIMNTTRTVTTTIRFDR